MDMQVNGYHIQIDGDTAIIDGDTHALAPGDTIELDGLTISRDEHGNVRTHSRGGDVVNSSSGSVSGSVFQAGVVNMVSGNANSVTQIGNADTVNITHHRRA